MITKQQNGREKGKDISCRPTSHAHTHTQNPSNSVKKENSSIYIPFSFPFSRLIDPLIFLLKLFCVVLHFTEEIQTMVYQEYSVSSRYWSSDPLFPSTQCDKASHPAAKFVRVPRPAPGCSYYCHFRDSPSIPGPLHSRSTEDGSCNPCIDHDYIAISAGSHSHHVCPLHFCVEVAI